MDFLLDSPTPEIRHDVPSVLGHLKDKLHKSAFWSRRLHQVVNLGQKDML